MLQSVLSAILLYHIIKALVRSAKKRKTSASTENQHAAINAATPERAMASEEVMWRNLIQALGDKPWMHALLRRASKPMGLRNMVLGALFGIAAFFLISMTVVIASASTWQAEEDLWAVGILGAMGLGTGWMAFHFWRDGLRLLKPESSTLPVTGATPYAAAKPQPATNSQKKREKQFQQL